MQSDIPEKKRASWNGARYIANSRAARQGGKLGSGEGIGAIFDTVG